VTAMKALVDYQRAHSPALRFRMRRFRLFRRLLDPLPRPVRILDVGGTELFWRTMGLAGSPDVELTVLNVDPLPPAATPGLRVVVGDARDLSRFDDGAFDVVFSNSVIEHVGDLEDQRRMAREVLRVGKAYFVQTPNRHFPLEPHFVFPFFQYLPLGARAWLLRHLSLGWCGRIRDREEARRIAASVRLIDGATVRRLFPNARIWRERVLGLAKSFVAYGGFDAPAAGRPGPAGRAGGAGPVDEAGSRPAIQRAK